MKFDINDAGLAHVIMCNDAVEAVVMEPNDTSTCLSAAVEKMEHLQRAYFAANRWSWSGGMYWSNFVGPYSHAWMQYKMRCRWHITTVTMFGATHATCQDQGA